MNDIITKELLSEVVGINITDAYMVNHTNLAYETMDTSFSIPVLNVYELINICKGWALIKYGFTITSFIFRSDKYPKGEYDGAAVIFFPDNETPSIRFDEGTEIDAVSKACQWILDNKDKS